jgi:hypothetical protein
MQPADGRPARQARRGAPHGPAQLLNPAIGGAMPADPLPQWALVALAIAVAAAVLGLALYGMGFRGMSDVLLRDLGRPLSPPF